RRLVRREVVARPWIPLVPWGSLVIAGVYFVAGKVGLTLASVHPSATTVWPPTGIALAATLLLGYRVWPALFAGAFLVNVTLGGYVSWEQVGAIWLTWWRGDVVGALVVAPVLILWGTDRTVHLTRARALELVLLLGSVFLVGWVVFGGPSSRTSGYPLTFLCTLPLAVAAFRFGLPQAATCGALP